MKLHEKKGVALLTVVIVIIILTILASAMLNLVSNQTRFVEHDISRTKAKYANEAVMVRQLERARRWGTSNIQGTDTVTGKYDSETSLWTAGISKGTVPIGSGNLENLTELNITIDYAPLF